MKRLLALFLFLTPLVALASFVIVYDVSSKRVTGSISSADSLQYYNRTGYLVNPVTPDGLFTNLNNFWVTNGAIQPVPQAVMDAEALAAWIANSNAVVLGAWLTRSNNIQAASWFMFDTNAEARIIRAFALLTLDQINTLRTKGTNALAIVTTNTFLNAMSNAVIADPR